MKSQREFPKTKASVAAARKFTRDVLSDLSEEVRDEVVLMTSELTTNALTHTDGAFVVTIERTETAVRISVSDSSALAPVERFPSAGQPHGRGLQIVNKLSDEWGSSRISGDGKTVWFRVDLRRAASVSN